MKILTILFALALEVVLATTVGAQATRKFPPDSLVNTKVIARETPLPEVIATMRGFSQGLGVRCQFCHVGTEGRPLTEFDFISDEKRTKIVARQMMLMVAEINHRLDSLPAGSNAKLTVSCATCHRGASRPTPWQPDTAKNSLYTSYVLKQRLPVGRTAAHLLPALYEARELGAISASIVTKRAAGKRQH